MEIAEKKPKVSVCVVTYNQEKYIRQCLQSIVDQATDFDFEVIVGDDCSTDRTRAIVLEFVSKYPHVLKPIFHENNIGPFKNYISVHQKAIGEYIAHVDGDDWCAPNKIASQAYYLNNNLDCIAVVHKLMMCDHKGIQLPNTWPERFNHKKYDLAQLVTAHPAFGHSSLMYKNGGIYSILNSEIDSFIDFQIYINLASQGHIGVLDQKLGRYTCGVGISSSKSLYGLATQALIHAKKLGLNQRIFQISMARQYLIFAKKALVEGDSTLFDKLISLSYNEKYLSFQQYILYAFRKKRKLLELGLMMHKTFKHGIRLK